MRKRLACRLSLHGEWISRLFRKSTGECLDTSLSVVADAIALTGCPKDVANGAAVAAAFGAKRSIDPQVMNEFIGWVATVVLSVGATDALQDACVAYGLRIDRHVDAESVLFNYRDESTSRLGGSLLVADNGMDAFRLIQRPLASKDVLRELLESEIQRKLVEQCGVSSVRCHVVEIVNAHRASPRIDRVGAQ